MASIEVTSLPLRMSLQMSDVIQAVDLGGDNYSIPADQVLDSALINFDPTDLPYASSSFNVQDAIDGLYDYVSGTASQSTIELLTSREFYTVGSGQDYPDLKAALIANAHKRLSGAINGELGSAVFLECENDALDMDEFVIDGLDLSHIEVFGVDNESTNQMITMSSEINPTVGDGEVYLMRFINGAKSPLFNNFGFRPLTGGRMFLVDGEGSVVRCKDNSIMATVNSTTDSVVVRNGGHIEGNLTANGLEGTLLTLDRGTAYLDNTTANESPNSITRNIEVGSFIDCKNDSKIIYKNDVRVNAIEPASGVFVSSHGNSKVHLDNGFTASNENSDWYNIAILGGNSKFSVGGSSSILSFTNPRSEKVRLNKYSQLSVEGSLSISSDFNTNNIYNLIATEGSFFSVSGTFSYGSIPDGGSIGSISSRLGSSCYFEGLNKIGVGTAVPDFYIDETSFVGAGEALDGSSNVPENTWQIEGLISST